MITQKVAEASAKVKNVPSWQREGALPSWWRKENWDADALLAEFCGGKMSSLSMTSVFSNEYESGSSLRGGCVGEA